VSNGLCDMGDDRKAIWFNSSGAMFCGEHFRALIRRNYGSAYLRPGNLHHLEDDGWRRDPPRGGRS
jgi:hypothetical protein